jgi:DNA-binding TFAR19-related protein (PDSD5 family)
MHATKKSTSLYRKPSLAAVRRAVASSTEVETGQNVQLLEQKLKEPAKRRFANVKLAI